MAISSITPYLSAVSNGYVVTPDDWNGIFDNIHGYLNTTVKPAIDALQAAPPPDVAAQGTFQGRFGLESGVAVSQGNVAGATNLYLNAFIGNLIGLYDDNLESWSNYEFTPSTPPTIAIPATSKELHDIWVSQSSGVIVLSQTGYKKVTASNNPTAGRDKVINLSDTDGIVVGDCVTVSDGSNTEEVGVTVVVASTSITVDWLKNGYTTPTIKTNKPLTNTVDQDGVLVQDGDTTKRYGCTILTSSSGTCDDSNTIRGVSNHYNRIPRHLRAIPAGADPVHSADTLWHVPGDLKQYGEDSVLFAVGRNPISWAAQGQRYHNTFFWWAIGKDFVQPVDAAAYGAAVTSAHFRGNGNAIQGRHVISTLMNPNSGSGTIYNTQTIGGASTKVGLLNCLILA